MGRYSVKKFAKLTEHHLCQSLFFNKVTGWKPETVCPLEMFCKKDILKNFVNFMEKHLCCNHLLTKLHFWGFETLLKKIQRQIVSSEICKSFKNNYFEEHLWENVSKLFKKRVQHRYFPANFEDYSRTSILQRIY